MSGSINGKTGEMVRWIVSLALGALVAYFTAQGAMQQRLSVVETTERLHYDEVQKSLNRIESGLEQNSTEFRRVLEDWRNGVDRRTGEPLPLQRAIESGR